MDRSVTLLQRYFHLVIKNVFFQRPILRCYYFFMDHKLSFGEPNELIQIKDKNCSHSIICISLTKLIPNNKYDPPRIIITFSIIIIGIIMISSRPHINNFPIVADSFKSLENSNYVYKKQQNFLVYII